jgi:uncharacterized BrkB/YihY/UPF0761 family membrane protein
MTAPEGRTPPASGAAEAAAILDAETPATEGSRLSGVRNRLRDRGDAPLARLASLWFRRYFEASRNSGAAASAYIALSALPTALVLVAIFDRATDDGNAFADRLITHMKLDDPTAGLAKDLFGTTADNLLAASVAVVIGFVVWGLSVGQLYQGVYARAWRVRVGAPADQLLFACFFFVFSGLVGLMTVSASELRAQGWLAVLPLWIAGSLIFWLWTPRFLLRGAVPLRALLPGALLATFVVGGTIATSPLWIGPTINQNGKAFGAFGVVVAVLAYVLILVTISMVCAVFSPVWAEWRQGKSDRSG